MTFLLGLRHYVVWVQVVVARLFEISSYQHWRQTANKERKVQRCCWWIQVCKSFRVFGCETEGWMDFDYAVVGKRGLK